MTMEAQKFGAWAPVGRLGMWGATLHAKVILRRRLKREGLTALGPTEIIVIPRHQNTTGRIVVIAETIVEGVAA